MRLRKEEAMITVRMCRAISLGEIIRQGRVFFLHNEQRQQQRVHDHFFVRDAIPHEVRPPESTNTLGMQLIKTLSEQLLGSFNFSSNDEGSTFTLTFDNKAEQALQA